MVVWVLVFEQMLTILLQFETLEWSLEPEGGQRISMLETESQDPFQQVAADPSAAAA